MQMYAYVAGVRMTAFGKHMDRSLTSLAVKADYQRATQRNRMPVCGHCP